MNEKSLVKSFAGTIQPPYLAIWERDFRLIQPFANDWSLSQLVVLPVNLLGLPYPQHLRRVLDSVLEAAL